MLYLKIYPLMLVGFFAIDLVWLGLVARPFYLKHLGFLLRESPNWPVAILFYLLFVAGILVFVVSPAIASDSWTRTILLGALFGLVTYGAYDLTNHATVKSWPWIVTVVDLCWGAVLTAAVSCIGFLAGKLWS